MDVICDWCKTKTWAKETEYGDLLCENCYEQHLDYNEDDHRACDWCGNVRFKFTTKTGDELCDECYISYQEIEFEQEDIKAEYNKEDWYKDVIERPRQ